MLVIPLTVLLDIDMTEAMYCNANTCIGYALALYRYTLDLNEYTNNNIYFVLCLYT